LARVVRISYKQNEQTNKPTDKSTNNQILVNKQAYKSMKKYTSKRTNLYLHE